MKTYARRHRVCGLLLLAWLLLGFVMLLAPSLFPTKANENWVYLFYDLGLGMLGFLTALTAAQDFSLGHTKVNNLASGILDENAVVSLSEMQEHIFYQILNIAQIMYLHFVRSSLGSTFELRAFGFTLVTSLWLLRSYFPVNPFQDNYSKGQNTLSLISVLYRTKKYQYVFYKHFLLHGLNATVAMDPFGNRYLVVQPYFRVYWLCLNVSYVMEFFLQSLVRAKYMTQSRMIFLQKLLMTASTIAAIHVLLLDVDIVFCILSLLMNFVNRGFDFLNVGIAVVIRFGVFLFLTIEGK